MEFRIMMMMSMGWSLTQIALSMNRSVKTISIHKTNISQKLGLNSSQLKVFLARGFLNYPDNN
ncbi:helix-turn-helix transcriptional regulator [Kluyvera sichuanensis]|uniref:helix-turn-helix transcriptional regulator n=1 Tax=Kluyvera sichuanensis TaxID=2725494 RepID=UPI0039F6478D